MFTTQHNLKNCLACNREFDLAIAGEGVSAKTDDGTPCDVCGPCARDAAVRMLAERDWVGHVEQQRQKRSVAKEPGQRRSKRIKSLVTGSK